MMDMRFTKRLMAWLSLWVGFFVCSTVLAGHSRSKLPRRHDDIEERPWRRRRICKLPFLPFS